MVLGRGQTVLNRRGDSHAITPLALPEIGNRFRIEAERGQNVLGGQVFEVLYVDALGQENQFSAVRIRVRIGKQRYQPPGVAGYALVQ